MYDTENGFSFGVSYNDIIHEHHDLFCKPIPVGFSSQGKSQSGLVTES